MWGVDERKEGRTEQEREQRKEGRRKASGGRKGEDRRQDRTAGWAAVGHCLEMRPSEDLWAVTQAAPESQGEAGERLGQRCSQCLHLLTAA